MTYEYIGKNLPLDKVKEYVVSFFESKNFKVVTKECDNVLLLSAVKRVEGETYRVSLKIYGAPKDFFIEFVHNANHNVLRMFGNFFSFFGLGIFLNWQLKKAEFLEKLKCEFLAYLDECFGVKSVNS
jgi:hypothetical protein